MSIATRLGELENDISNAYDAIEYKGGVLSGVNKNTHNLSDCIYSIPTDPLMDDIDNGGVIFINYNGDVLYQYNTSRSLSMTSMPSLPNNTGFKNETWNWTLAEIQSALNDDNKAVITVGVNLMTADDKTHLWYEVIDTNRTIEAGIRLNGTCTIDWGDGTATNTITGTNKGGLPVYATHTYSQNGTYEITYTAGSNTQMQILGGGMYTEFINATSSNIHDKQRLCAYIKKLYIGNNIQISQYGLGNMRGVEEISIPYGCVVSSENLFMQCSKLRGVVVPRDVTTAGANFCYYALSLEYLALPPVLSSVYYSYCLAQMEVLRYIYVPNGPTSTQTSFLNNCYCLRRAHIPNTLTSLGGYSLTQISMPEIILPATNFVNNANSICGNLYYTKKLDLSAVTATKIYNYSFSSLYNLEELIFSNTITEIGDSCFSYIFNLKELNLPNALTKIGNYCFSNLYCCAKVKFPSTLTSIGNNAFATCQGTLLYDFRDFTSIPTLGNTNCFSSPNTGMKIVVPDNLYSDWIAATNWSSKSSYIVRASDYTGGL